MSLYTLLFLSVVSIFFFFYVAIKFIVVFPGPFYSPLLLFTGRLFSIFSLLLFLPLLYLLKPLFGLVSRTSFLCGQMSFLVVPSDNF
ncbi:wsv232 [White spot syndrome virus]|uniref:Wsv232 n=3 Tax=White spot syndrome virus TaxID=342409 RepID=Q8VAY6_WSSVS|nr:wsv232 [Shrimp white spot syndrome virus]AFX59609.1 wsv232 [White spot syndrome virus]AAL33236.1 wsv232 [Shrimp white spot syndrome virus]AAL89155.1 WSSV287 [Shrimp white spot syndrome virus]AWQ60403.1 wsv232 [Shrimp white spot syndrome virus]AWQ60818.1 wsv232 [Shrimp white spot syndrome virus]